MHKTIVIAWVIYLGTYNLFNDRYKNINYNIIELLFGLPLLSCFFPSKTVFNWSNVLYSDSALLLYRKPILHIHGWFFYAHRSQSGYLSIIRKNVGTLGT